MFVSSGSIYLVHMYTEQAEQVFSEHLWNIK